MYVTVRQRHNQAMLAPSGKDEKAIVQMLRGLQEYQQILEASDAEPARAALKQGLSDIARGLEKLIQGPMGRLDAELLAQDLAPFFQFFAATPARRSCPKTPRIARSARAPSHEFFDRKLFPNFFFFSRTNFGSKKCSMNFIYFSNQIFQYFFHISKKFSPAALGRNAIVISVFVLIAMRF